MPTINYKPRRRIQTLLPTPNAASVTHLDEGVFSDSRHAFSRPASALPSPPPLAENYGDFVSNDRTTSQQTTNNFNQAAPNAERFVVKSMMVNIILEPSVPQILLNENARRVGLILQNLDANVVAANLFFSFGIVTTTTAASPGNAFQLTPGAFVLLDFTTPVDVIWGTSFGASSSQITLVEFTKVYY